MDFFDAGRVEIMISVMHFSYFYHNVISRLVEISVS